MTKRVSSCLGRLTVILAVLLTAGGAFFFFKLRPALDCVTLRENGGRGVWVAIVSANAERGGFGKSLFWPQDLGFDRTRTSTDYFRRLMADEHGLPTADISNQLVTDLTPLALGGAGIPVVKSAAEFTDQNNVWTVVCVGSNAPSDTAFLVSRNVYFGSTVNATSTIHSVRSPMHWPVRNRVVWVTCGGAAFECSLIDLTAAKLFPSTNTTYDVMYP